MACLEQQNQQKKKKKFWVTKANERDDNNICKCEKGFNEDLYLLKIPFDAVNFQFIIFSKCRASAGLKLTNCGRKNIKFHKILTSRSLIGKNRNKLKNQSAFN